MATNSEPYLKLWMGVLEGPVEGVGLGGVWEGAGNSTSDSAWKTRLAFGPKRAMLCIILTAEEEP